MRRERRVSAEHEARRSLCARARYRMIPGVPALGADEAAAGEPAAAAANEQADEGAGPSRPSANKKRKVPGDEGWGKIEEGLSGEPGVGA